MQHLLWKVITLLLNLGVAGMDPDLSPDTNTEFCGWYE
jgi:hypothetical protein